MGQKLTERQQVTTSDNNDLIHVVRNNQSYQMKAELIGSTIINESSSGNWVKGGISWTGTGLTYNVWVNECAINSTVYNTLVSSQVTLSDGDATNPRIDKFVIEVNDFASPPTFEIKAVEGTPAASPVEPSINLVNQAEIGFRITAANETTDPVTQLETIYDENTGESAEWDNDSLPPGSNLDYATSPYKGSKCLYVPNVIDSEVRWINDSLITYNESDSLVFALRANLSTSSRFQIKLINSSNNTYFLRSFKASDLKRFGGSESEVDWQLLQIKLSDFAPSSRSNTQYDSIEIRFIKTPILSLDWLHIQSDLGQPTNPTKFTDLGDTPNNYSGQAGKVATVKSDETGLEFGDANGGGTELIDEGNGDGLVIVGRNSANYGNVGLNAVDFSVSTGVSSERGSTAEAAITFGEDIKNNETYSFVTGYANELGQDTSGTGYQGYNTVHGSLNKTHKNSQENLVSGYGNIVGTLNGNAGINEIRSWQNLVSGRDNTAIGGVAMGLIGANLISSSAASIVVGISNIDRTVVSTTQNQSTTWFTADHGNALFVVGNGTYNIDNNAESRSNALEVYHSGAITAPSLTPALITTSGDPSLITKEYADENYKLKSYTVGTLPAGTIGDEAYVTDALAPAYLTTAVGGGAVVCKVFFNGTNWIT